MSTIVFRNENAGAAQRVVDQVRSAVDRGLEVTVAGRRVAGYPGHSANVWGNGTVSFSVAARNGRPHSYDDVWVSRPAKAPVSIEISEARS